MQVVKIENNAVLIRDGDIEAWVDVWVRDGELYCEWNKYIFFLNNNVDLAQRDWQDSADNYMEATELAVKALEKAGIIILHIDGRYMYLVDSDLNN